jgi:hypothetical protein
MHGMANDIPFTKPVMIQTFFILAQQSPTGLYFTGHIPVLLNVHNLFGNNNLLSIFDQVTTLL